MSRTMVRVGDISEQIRGVSYSKGDAISTPDAGYLPLLRAGNIRDDGLTFDDLVYVPEQRISKKQLIRSGDVVIAASSGSIDVVGKAAPSHQDFEGGFGAFCKVLRPNVGMVASNYFYHYFKTTEYRRKMSSLAAGANINNLKSEHLDDLLIPLPPLPEQRRIAAILDKADALRAKRREALEQLDKLAQSIFVEMFGDPVTNPKGWTEATVGDVGSVQGGLQLSSKRSSLPLTVPYLRVANVYRDRLVLDEIKSFQATAAELEKTQLVKNDVLIVEGHGNPDEIGRCAIWDGSIEGCSHQNHLIRLRVHRGLAVPAYVARFLNSEGGRKGLLNASNTTSGLNTISVSKIRGCRLLLPPIKLQEAYFARLSKVEEMTRKQTQSLFELDRLFSSLQQRLMEGNARVERSEVYLAKQLNAKQSNEAEMEAL